MEEIGVGFAATDHWYTAFALVQNLRANDGFKIVSVSNPHKSRAIDLACAAGDVKIEEDWRKILDDSSVDIVVNLASADRIAEISTAVANSGKHLLCG